MLQHNLQINMTQDEQKQAAAQAAIQYVPKGSLVGVGTGSTANYFIDALATIKHQIEGAVASSQATAERLKKHGIEVVELNNADNLPVYVDGADEVTRHLHMIKGGGGALTREKIVAAVARKFICIADQSKLVDVLGNFPLPVEVIPMARSYVAREIALLGGQPALRVGFQTAPAGGDAVQCRARLCDDVVGVAPVPGLGDDPPADTVDITQDGLVLRVNRQFFRPHLVIRILYIVRCE